MSTRQRKFTDASKTEEIDLFMTCSEEEVPPRIHNSTTKSQDVPKRNAEHRGPSTSEGSKRSKILGELENELERQLEEKAKRNELQGNNVKSLLRAVLTQEDVFKYVESKMAKSDELPEYQLKLTRAKAKELIDRIPKIAPLLCLPTPQKKSDIDVLIREELPEDSSDEEYQPLDENADDDEDFSLASNIMSPPMSTPTPEPVVTGPDENIGQRTRSKLSLSETPLEAIEQAFIPPDITEDMYNTECDNQDWLNFLKELVQPLDTSSGQEAHDDENDPEYNVQPDELEVPDNEELRADSAVKISKKEINDLIDELFEYTKMHEDGFPSDDEKTKEDVDSLATQLQFANTEKPYQPPKSDDQTSGNKYPLETQDDPLKVTQHLQKRASPTAPMIAPAPAKKCKRVHSVFSEEQYLLIMQQLAQHVQLLLQTYLLSCGSPFVTDEIRQASKSYLGELKTYLESTGGAEFPFSLPTLDKSLELLSQYETIVNKNLQAMLKWNEEKAAHKTYVKTRWAGSPPVHPILMKLCLRSKAFQYPLLLPYYGFKDAAKAKTSLAFSRAQEHLISSGLHDCVTNLGMTINDNKRLMECCSLIHKSLIPDRKPIDIFNHVKRKCSRGLVTNPIRQYFLYKCSPPVEHFVVPLEHDKLLPLYLQDTALIHINWHRALYKERDYQKALLVEKKRKLSEKATESIDIKYEVVITT